MAAYTQQTDIEAANVGPVRLTALIDRDRDGTADVGALAAVILEAGAIIDARLGQKYAVPFAAITDTPDTPDIVQVIARHIVLWKLYAFFEPEGNHWKHHYDEANFYMTEILKGTLTIPGAGLVEADEGLRKMKYSAGDPKFAGRDSDGVRRMRGM